MRVYEPQYVDVEFDSVVLVYTGAELSERLAVNVPPLDHPPTYTVSVRGLASAGAVKTNPSPIPPGLDYPVVVAVTLVSGEPFVQVFPRMLSVYWPAPPLP